MSEEHHGRRGREVGEVRAQETVMHAYFEDDDATAAALDDEGFLHTGDLGVFDADGWPPHRRAHWRA
ncbi:MAG: AMP-binding protein [Acidimicrobiia bacterium]